jgi:hypothetical protein
LYKLCGQPERSAQELSILAAVELQNNSYAKATARAYRDIGNFHESERWAKRAVFTNLYDADAHKILEEVEEKLGDTAGVAREQRVLGELARWQAMMDAAATQPS